MDGDERPRRDSRAAADPVTRAVVVVGLVAFAAAALPGRRGLDWDELTEATRPGWAQALLVGAAVAWVVVGLLTLRRLFRKLRLEPRDEEPSGEPRRVHWGILVLAGLIVAGAFALALAVLVQVVNQGRNPRMITDGPGKGAGTGLPDGGVPLLLGVLLAALAAVLVVRLTRRRSTSSAAVDRPDDPPDDLPLPDATVLAEAVTAAGQVLGRLDDTRAAIIATYAAMEHSLARRGTRREAADTPSELLGRAVAAGLVSDGAAGRLTELFREARFSRHPMPPVARHDAEQALARVSAELGGQRV